MPVCRCREAALLWGAPADDYTYEHLVHEEVREATGDVLYRCPETGRRWIGEFVPDDAGITTFRLRRLMRAAELIEMLAAGNDPGAGLQFTHPEVEFRPAGSKETFHGVEAARQFIYRRMHDPDPPLASAISVIDVTDDEVVVLGNIAYKRDGAYAENRPGAWLVTLRNGCIIRSLWFDSWKAARRAAGLPDEGGPATRRLREGFMMPLLRRPRLG